MPLLVLSAYFVLALLGTFPLALQFGSAIPGDGFDGLQNYWNLWWVRRALLDLQTSPFFTRDLFYPTGASLLFHTLNIFNGLWALPVQLLGGLAVSYNSIVLFTFVISGYGGFLLAKEAMRVYEAPNPKSQMPFSVRKPAVGFSERQKNWAAFAAGFVFAFAPVRFAHLLGHMQVLSSEWLPFFVLTYWRGTREVGLGQKPWLYVRCAILPALFLLLNALCDWYFVLYCIIFVGLVVVWRWIEGFGEKRQNKRTSGDAEAGPRSIEASTGIGAEEVAHAESGWRRLLMPAAYAAAVGGLFVLFISPVLLPMLGEASSAAYLRPPFEETIQLSADLLAIVTPSEFHPWWGEIGRAVADNFSSSTAERDVFAGYTVLALAAVGVWRWRSKVVFWLATALLFLVLALGPYLHVLGHIVTTLPLPYAWLYALIPVVRITRSVSRFDLMLMLALGVLAGMGLLALRQRPRLAATACALVALEFLAIPYPMWPVSVPAFYSQIAQEPGDFAVLELPINWDRPDPLLYQTIHAHPLITAYTSRSNPLSLVERTPVLNLLRTLEPDIIQYDVRLVGPSVLSDLSVRYLINHPLTMGEGDERTVTNRVLQQLFGNRAPVVNEPNLVAYRVTPPAAHVPYLVLGSGWGDLQTQDGLPARRRIEPWAQLLLPGPQSQPFQLSITASGVQGSARLAVAPKRNDLQRLGPTLDLPATPVTVTVALPPLSELWLTSDAPVVVYSVGVQ